MIVVNVLWYLKQLLPLTYRSEFIVYNNDEKEAHVFSVWKMWFGRCYDVDEFIVLERLV